MATGTIKMFNAARGFAFIKPDDGGEDLFLHITNCAQDIEVLEQNQRVRFDRRTSPRTGRLEAYACAAIE